MKLEKENTVFWNHGDGPIFISVTLTSDLIGLEEKENKIIILPGDGIDISCLNLRSSKPEAQPHSDQSPFPSEPIK